MSAVVDPSGALTVAQIVLDQPACARVLQRHRIDYGWAGHETLEAACAGRGVSVEAVRAELEEARRNRPAGPPVDPRALPTRALLALIVGRHHTYLRRALPSITVLAAKVARVQGYRAPKLPQMAAAVQAIADTLSRHLDHQEQVLFPGLVVGQDLRLQLHETADEHRMVTELLDRVHEASDGFTTPPWGCVSYRALAVRLSVLDADVRQHIHLENHVLIPRFLAGDAGGPTLSRPAAGRPA